ncbi:MAG: TldD/PmbA family protein [Gemmatimonadaceae bacterium]|nr:TldD/PmbA family protein [Gemmatimonadaceae bacterium]
MIKLASTRRAFVKAGSAAALAIAAGSRRGWTQAPDVSSWAQLPEAGQRELAMRAIDAARAAGADYADVRFSHVTYLSLGTSNIGMEPPSQTERISYGIRSLVSGVWGFVAGQDYAPESVARLARTSVLQAKANSTGTRRTLQLAPVPPVPDGKWDMAVRIDPFKIAMDDQLNLMTLAIEATSKVKATASMRIVCGFDWQREERIFASTDGSFIVQTLFRGMPYDGGAHVTVQARDDVFNYASSSVQDLDAAGKGYEMVLEADLVNTLPQAAEEALRMLSSKPVQVGRYDLVVHARAMASPLSDTLGRALEYDRAAGLEANAQGTSFIAPPQDVLGKMRAGSQLLTVKGDRSQPGSLAAVGWDDEGVKPREFTLVKDGVVVDYHTTREMAMKLDWWYKQQGRETRSHGCCGAGSADRIPMQHMPNLSMQPGAGDLSFEDIIADTKNGIAISGGSAGSIDQQLLNGQYGATAVQEIRNGKLAGYLRGLNYQFRAPEFWKSMDAIGGKRSYVLCGSSSRKGQPLQSSVQSIGTVPARFRQVNVINVGRAR